MPTSLMCPYSLIHDKQVKTGHLWGYFLSLHTYFWYICQQTNMAIPEQVVKNVPKYMNGYLE